MAGSQLGLMVERLTQGNRGKNGDGAGAAYWICSGKWLHLPLPNNPPFPYSLHFSCEMIVTHLAMVFLMAAFTALLESPSEPSSVDTLPPIAICSQRQPSYLYFLWKGDVHAWLCVWLMGRLNTGRIDILNGCVWEHVFSLPCMFEKWLMELDAVGVALINQ